MIGYFTGQSSAAIFPIWSLKLLQLSRFWTWVMVAALNTALILWSNEVAPADEFFDPKLWLQQLRTADRVVLMIVPVGSYFPIALNAADLGSVSCQYAVEPGPVFEELLHVLDRNIIEYKTGPMKTGVRIGIIFETDRKVVQEFYSNDRGGPGKLVGLSGDRLVTLKAGLPSELRALVIRPSVALIKDHYSRCPHA
jgi:hypothetical protein